MHKQYSLAASISSPDQLAQVTVYAQAFHALLYRLEDSQTGALSIQSEASAVQRRPWNLEKHCVHGEESISNRHTWVVQMTVRRLGDQQNPYFVEHESGWVSSPCSCSADWQGLAPGTPWAQVLKDWY